MKEEKLAEFLDVSIATHQGKIEWLSKMKTAAAKYPDLDRNVFRWDKVCYATAAVNNRVTDYDQRHNCGCCADSPIEVFPYFEEDGLKLYSSPACFHVGQANYGNGEIPAEGWDAKMREAGIPESIIAQIQKFFDNHKPKDWDEVEEDSDE